MAGKTTKRVAKRRAPIRRRKMARRRAPMEFASCKETLALPDVETNTVYGPGTIDLSSFKRASGIAREYQEYRITKVTWAFKPQFDTFMANTDAATALRVPYFYSVIDRNRTLPLASTLATLQAMGAKPRRFDDKTLTVSYRPAVQAAVYQGAGVSVASSRKMSPWLSTNQDPDAAWIVSEIDHDGLFWTLDAGVLPGDGQYEYGINVTIECQFRKPFLPIAGGENPKLAKNPFTGV